MNRKERHRSKVLLRHQTRAIEVHEASHAVGRIMTAESLGWLKEEAIESIEINSPSSVDGAVRQSIDGIVALATLATTFGPFLSRPMEEFLRARMLERFAGGGSIERTEIAQGLYLDPPERALVLSLDEKRARFKRWTAPSRACR